MSDRKPCEASDECLHPLCHVCGRLIRSNNIPAADHPGTVLGRTRSRLCLRDRERGHPEWVPPQPTWERTPRIKYEGDQLLTSKEIGHMRVHHPHMYAWHMQYRIDKATRASQATEREATR